LPAAAGPGRQWPEGEWFCRNGPFQPGCASPEGAGALVESPHLKLRAGAAPWLPPIIAVLRGNRPPVFHPDAISLITGEGGTQYLVVDWNGPRWLFPRVEFHKVIRDADGRHRIKWLRSIDYLYADVSAVSGRVLFEGEAPVVVVNLMDSGSSPFIDELRLIQMKRDSVDITPDWAGRVVNVVDLDGDGRFEVVTDNHQLVVRIGERIHRPFLPAVLTRAKGRFVYDCRRFADVFVDRGQDLERSARWEDVPVHRSALFSEAFLGFVQAGAYEEARRMQRLVTGLAFNHPDDDFTAEQIDEDLSAVLEWAKKHPEEACPVSARDNPGGPNGALMPRDQYRQMIGVAD
jgi:hypothetical protein